MQKKNEENYGKVCGWLANGVHMVCTWRAYGVHKCTHKCVRRGVHRGVHWRALGRAGRKPRCALDVHQGVRKC